MLIGFVFNFCICKIQLYFAKYVYQLIRIVLSNTPSKNSSDDRAETRKVVLQAARRLFLEFGFHAVSTRQIAEACGLTQPALYHHFANK